MDRITEGFLSEFTASHSLGSLETDTQFEHFSNFCALSAETGQIDIDILDMHTGEATQGIDGIAIEVNGAIVDSKDDIEMLIRQNKHLDVRFIFVQAKTSESFSNGEIGNFLGFVQTFFSETASQVFATEEMHKFIELRDVIYDNSKYMKLRNPILRLYYIAPGKWNSDDVSLNAMIKVHIAALESTVQFSRVDFIPCGASEIQRMYRKSKETLQTTFIFSKQVSMFSDDNGDFGYIGVLPFREFRKIICDENGSLRSVFEDNIRDFLGTGNDVNSEIEQTLQGGRVSSFCMLNNGITIVASLASLVSDRMTITNYQIVNGCQTSHILFQNRDMGGIDEILIPIKIVVTTDEELKNQITKATNSQTSITKEQLEALSTFQKLLEEYYKTYTAENERLFYERRSGQYKNDYDIKARIVTIRAQLKSAAAMFLDKPHDAAGHYSLLLKEIGTNIFMPDDQPILYYTSSLALLRFEELIKQKKIAKEYRKGKFHAIMLLKYTSGAKFPKHNNAKAMIKACQRTLDILNSPKECLNAFEQVIRIMDQINLGDRKVFEKKETTDALVRKTLSR